MPLPCRLYFSWDMRGPGLIPAPKPAAHNQSEMYFSTKKGGETAVSSGVSPAASVWRGVEFPQPALFRLANYWAEPAGNESKSPADGWSSFSHSRRTRTGGAGLGEERHGKRAWLSSAGGDLAAARAARLGGSGGAVMAKRLLVWRGGTGRGGGEGDRRAMFLKPVAVSDGAEQGRERGWNRRELGLALYCVVYYCGRVAAPGSCRIGRAGAAGAAAALGGGEEQGASGCRERRDG